jgi:hypothetical protein
MSRRSLVAAGLTLLLALPVLARAQCSLTNATNWCAHEDANGVSGGAEDDDHFGGALAFGDFNGDGFDDLAVGAPGENDGAGVVYVFYSNHTTPVVTGHQLFGQAQLAGADEGPENGDGFGSALAAGDFDDDGLGDLAIGSPGEDLPEGANACTFNVCQDAGGVHVVYGSAAGLDVASAEFFNQADLHGTGNNVGEHNRLGTTLAVADFNFLPDGIDDLAVGAPADPTGILQSHGQVFIAFGSEDGFNQGLGGFAISQDFAACDNFASGAGSGLATGQLESDADRELVLGAPFCDVGGVAATGSLGYLSELTGAVTPDAIFQTDYSTAGNGPDDHFGTTLAIGDFDGNGFDDLAAAAPNKNHGTGNPNDSGRVYVAYSIGSGPDPDVTPDIIGEDEWAGDTPGEGEQFGSALAAGDVDGDGFDDLLSGAPGEGSLDVGRIYLKRGSAGGLTTANNALFTQTFLGGSNGTDDHLGNVIALGDVDGDGALEIALGVPDKDVGTADDAGMVYVTRAFSPRIFSDGFETGDKGRWSASTP